LKLSVVVPAFNEERLLAGTLQHIAAAAEAFAARGWRSEIIVCDNNSTDGTAEVARAAGATVIFEPVNQISRARNAGAAQASGHWLVFVDADSSPSRALFDNMAECIAAGRCVGGGSTVTLPGVPASVAFWVALWNATSRAMSWAAGAFFFCEAQAFRAAGGFSEELYAAEEIDLSRRLKKAARLQGRSFVILGRHPLVTSGRKAYLYSAREHGRFLLGTLFSGGRRLRRRECCNLWYDGRR
jgi:glycosyltransferase involved in cell wall biosynthesis